MLIFLLWYIIGYIGFVYWTTKEFDFDLGWAVVGLFVSALGPLTWLIGWAIFADDDPLNPERIILFKKREGKPKQ